jgi:hypothetical protein
MPSITDKVAYVKSQGQTRAHHCHWPGCDRQVPPAMWGCKIHWYRLPAEIRRDIWNAYRPGQERTQTPSRAYVEAAQRAQEWIAAYGANVAPSQESRLIDKRTRDLFDN